MAKKVKKTTKKATSKKKAVKKKTAAKKTVKKKKAAVKKTVVKKKKVTKKKSTAKKAVKKKAAPKTKSPKKATIKKTATMKPSAATRSVSAGRKRPKTHLSKAELQHYRELLVEKLKEIIGNVNHIELESLKKSRIDASGDLSSMPIHMADVGSDNYEQEFALGLMDSERKIVMEIQAALKRIENNSYGICEGTFEPIPKPRLEGIPWTRYCVQYAEMLEKGLVVAEENWYDDDDEEDAVIEDDESDADELDTDYDDDKDDDEDGYDDEDNIEDLYYGYDDDEDED